jgi:hypothetical protein
MESRNITKEPRPHSRELIIQLFHGTGLKVTEISDGYGFHSEYVAEVLSHISVEICNGFYVIESKLNYLDNRKNASMYNQYR